MYACVKKLFSYEQLNTNRTGHWSTWALVHLACSPCEDD